MLTKIFRRLLKSIFKKFDLHISPIENNDLTFTFVESNFFEREIINLCRDYSMTGDIRMWGLIQSFKHVVNNKIEGDFVECGVWKGGNLILLQKMIEKYNIKDKKIFGFDTFAGMPEPTNLDIDDQGNKIKDVLQTQEKNEDVISSAKLFFEDISCMKFIKGKVEDTLLKDSNLPNKISLLRLDTDWYESTKIELEILYPRLQIGGVLIIDDYGYNQGEKKAVDEYFKNQKIWMHYLDRESRLLLKKSRVWFKKFYCLLVINTYV